MTTATLDVPDISCEHCERTVKAALSGLDGVQHVAVDIPTKRVRVRYDEARVDVERLKDVLSAEEYPVARVTTTPTQL